MRLSLTDVFSGHSKVIEGGPLTVEEELRGVFPGMFTDIPHGDLAMVLWRINRMHGYSLVIIDASDYIPGKPVRIKRPANEDPWIREIDTMPSPSDSK